jgi:hypothetical protein
MSLWEEGLGPGNVYPRCSAPVYVLVYVLFNLLSQLVKPLYLFLISIHSDLLSILINEKTTAKIAESGKRVCLKIGLHFTHSPMSETSPLPCQNFQNKVTFESKFGRENLCSIYSNVREFPSVVCRPFPEIRQSGWTAHSRYPVKLYPHRGTTPRSGYLWYPDWAVLRLLLGLSHP